MLRDAESTYIEQILYTCINEYLYLCNIYAIYIYKVSAQVVVYPVPFTLVGCVSVSRPRALLVGPGPF